MSLETYANFLSLLKLDLTQDMRVASRSGGGDADPEVRLALTIRMLSRASSLDLMMLFRVASSTIYDVFHRTIASIIKRIPMPGLPFQQTSCRTSPCPSRALVSRRLCTLCMLSFRVHLQTKRAACMEWRATFIISAQCVQTFGSVWNDPLSTASARLSQCQSVKMCEVVKGVRDSGPKLALTDTKLQSIAIL
jgi:hypothetical protein